VSVPDTDTTYWCRVHELPKELKDKHHIIQYQAVIQEGNEALPKILENCKRVIAAWAMGAGPLSYPKQAGLPIGGANYSLYAMLEIHYNNPELRSDWVDS
ncbi:unnamed protein product, partial [Oppiella nova]